MVEVLNWMAIIVGTLIIVIGLAQLLSNKSLLITDEKKYTKDSIAKFIEVDGMGNVLVGIGLTVFGWVRNTMMNPTVFTCASLILVMLGVLMIAYAYGNCLKEGKSKAAKKEE